jgi:hypothetical protein
LVLVLSLPSLERSRPGWARWAIAGVSLTGAVVLAVFAGRAGVAVKSASLVQLALAGLLALAGWQVWKAVRAPRAVHGKPLSAGARRVFS